MKDTSIHDFIQKKHIPVIFRDHPEDTGTLADIIIIIIKPDHYRFNKKFINLNVIMNRRRSSFTDLNAFYEIKPAGLQAGVRSFKPSNVYRIIATFGH